MGVSMSVYVLMIMGMRVIMNVGMIMCMCVFSFIHVLYFSRLLSKLS